MPGRGHQPEGVKGGGRGKSGGRHHVKRPRQPKTVTAEAEGNVDVCAICAENLTFYSVGECNHPQVCSKCAFRSRLLLRDRACNICKQPLEKVIVAQLQATGPRLFADFDVWGVTAGPNSAFDDNSGILFIDCKAHMDELLKKNAPCCPTKGCSETFSTLEEVSTHLRSKHQRHFCSLCMAHRPLFLAEQEVFTTLSMKQHEQALDGHPLCRFCNVRYFDATALYRHMVENHITCHCCGAAQQQRYYLDTGALRTHLRNAHFLCEMGACRGGGLGTTAFTTLEAYSQHLREDHGITDSESVTRTLNFRVRRANRDGSGIEGEVEDLIDGLVVEPPAPSQQRSQLAPGARVHRNNHSMANTISSSRGSSARGANAFPSLPPPTVSAAPALSSQSFLARPWAGRPETQAPPPAPSASWAESLVASGVDPADAANQAVRNMRLAAALGVRQPGLNEAADLVNRGPLRRVIWSKDALTFAREKPSDVARIEKQIAALLADPKGTSTQLKPSKREIRKCHHEIAEAYGLNTASYDAEPKRYVSVIKTKNADRPANLLSKAALDPEADALATALANIVYSPPRYVRPQGPPPAPADLKSCVAVSTGLGGPGADDILQTFRRWIGDVNVFGVRSRGPGLVSAAEIVIELASTEAAAAVIEALERTMREAEEAALMTRAVVSRPFSVRMYPIPPKSATSAEATEPVAAPPRFPMSALAGKLPPPPSKTDTSIATISKPAPVTAAERRAARREAKYFEKKARKENADKDKNKSIWQELSSDGSTNSDEDGSSEEVSESSADEKVENSTREHVSAETQAKEDSGSEDDDWEAADIRVIGHRNGVAPARTAAESSDAWDDVSQAEAERRKAEVANAAAIREGAWECSQCTALNGVKEKSCKVCGLTGQGAWSSV